MSVPPHYTWLQKRFHKFRNSLRSGPFFANKEQNSNKNFKNNNGLNNPPKRICDSLAPKTNLPELETFLTAVKCDLF